MDKKGLISSHYDEKQIMEYYYKCNITDKLPIYKNITRSDGVGSCCFFRKNNRYYLYDFSQGKNYGIYDIVMSINNCTFAEALDIMISDLNITFNFKKETYDKIQQSKDRQYERIDKEHTAKVFRYELRNYGLFDKTYWQQFSIGLATLKKFGVRPVRNIEMFAVSNQQYFNLYDYKNDFESLTYYFPVKDKLRFYMPNSKERRNKWKGNTNNECVFGFEQLDLNSPLKEIFICSGLKDLMCMSELGFDAIAPMSEPTSLPNDVIEALKSTNKRIIYLYDTDLAGLKYGVKYACLHGFEAMWLPNIPGLKLKDVADFMQYFDKEGLLEIINTMLN